MSAAPKMRCSLEFCVLLPKRSLAEPVPSLRSGQALSVVEGLEMTYIEKGSLNFYLPTFKHFQCLFWRPKSGIPDDQATAWWLAFYFANLRSVARLPAV